MKASAFARLSLSLAAVAALLAACAHKGNPASAGLVPYAGPDKILAADPASRTVTLNLVAGEGAAAKGFNFNGFANGTMHVQVPTGWTVKVSMVDQAETPHSALVVPWSQRQGGNLTAAFTGSAPADFRSGIEKGDDPQTFTFMPDKAGAYAIVCGVQGHIDAGMWDTLDVVDNLAAPQVLVTK